MRHGETIGNDAVDEVLEGSGGGGGRGEKRMGRVNEVNVPIQ